MIKPDLSLVKVGWTCKCPKCKKASIYKPGLTLTLLDNCPSCDLNLAENDSADGPAVFLIFILGALLVPLALVLDAYFDIALWVHGVLWSVVALIITVGALRPLKAYIIALQYKYLPWDEKK